MLISYNSFKPMKTVYIQFHLDKAHSLSLLFCHIIKITYVFFFLSCNQNCLCAIPFNKNKTLIGVALPVVYDTQCSYAELAYLSINTYR
jgi:hypothetical protein